MHSRCDPTENVLPPFPGPETLRRLFHGLLGLLPGRPYRGPRPLLSWRGGGIREGRVVQVVIGELQVDTEREGGLLRVRLTGKSASRDAGRELQPAFERLLAAAREEQRTLILHFEKLEYFNSSTIAALVQFIRTAQQAGVSMVVRYDASLKWQAMSFDALSRALRPFAPGHGPTLRFEGSDGPA